MAGMTALALVDAAGLTPGQTVLIAGATGGIGSYALQLGSAGARVSATLCRAKTRALVLAWCFA